MYQINAFVSGCTTRTSRSRRQTPASSLGVVVLGLASLLCATGTGCGGDPADASGGSGGLGGAAGSGDPTWADCLYPPTGTRCECHPFSNFAEQGPQCETGESCSLRLLQNPDDPGLLPFRLPAVDGSDGTKTTVCVPAETQSDQRGEPCTEIIEPLNDTMSVRYDTCAPNLFCANGACWGYCGSLQDSCCVRFFYGLEADIGVCVGGFNFGGFGGFGGVGGTANAGMTAQRP